MTLFARSAHTRCLVCGSALLSRTSQLTDRHMCTIYSFISVLQQDHHPLIQEDVVNGQSDRFTEPVSVQCEQLARCCVPRSCDAPLFVRFSTLTHLHVTLYDSSKTVQNIAHILAVCLIWIMLAYVCSFYMCRIHVDHYCFSSRSIVKNLLSYGQIRLSKFV